jgi:hypothetical protein
MAFRFPHHSLYQARLRHEMALRACEGLFPSKDLDSFRISWSDILSNAGAVVHAIEGGSKSTPQLRQWYGGIRRKMNDSEFLRYMYHARNSDEHNVTRSIGLKARALDFPSGKFMLEENIEITSDGVILPPSVLIATNGNQVKIPRGAQIVLWRIVDERHGNIYEVPKYYGLEKLDRCNPPQFAELYVNFLLDLINEAAAL